MVNLSATSYSSTLVAPHFHILWRHPHAHARLCPRVFGPIQVAPSTVCLSRCVAIGALGAMDDAEGVSPGRPEEAEAGPAFLPPSPVAASCTSADRKRQCAPPPAFHSPIHQPERPRMPPKPIMPPSPFSHQIDTEGKVQQGGICKCIISIFFIIQNIKKLHFCMMKILKKSHFFDFFCIFISFFSGQLHRQIDLLPENWKFHTAHF